MRTLIPFFITILLGDPMLEQFPWYVQSAIKVGVTVIVAVILERIATRYLSRFVERVEWPAEVEAALIPITRFAIIMGCVLAILEIGGLPSGWFAAFMGLGGAAIGFASTRSIGNFIAGLYVLVSRPFTVRDYIRIEKIEGIVQEITINYTKILTPANTIVLLSNQEVLGKNIVNFRFEEGGKKYYCYSFEVGFDHSVPARRLHELFDRSAEKYGKLLPRKPEYSALSMDRSERRYIFYLYFDKPEEIFVKQPQFLDELITAWDEARLRTI